MSRQPDPVGQLLALTLALEYSISNDLWHEVEPLLQAREEVLGHALRAGKGDMKRVQAAEARVMTLLTERRQGVLRSIREAASGRKVPGAYAGGRRPAEFVDQG